MSSQKPSQVGMTVLAVAALAPASCASQPDPPTDAVSSATVAMFQTLKERALAYPEARITNVRQKGVVACGLVRLEGHRPHVVLATNLDDRWVVSTPYLALPNSWNDDRNRTLSDAKAEQCTHFGVALPPP